MTTGTLPHHISRQFDHELEDVRSKVMAMGGLVEQQLFNALSALTENDMELVDVVIGREVEVNSYEVMIDLECTRILARRQPAASDLRLVMAITKTITDLERIGDEAEKVAKMALDLAEKQAPRPYYVGINTMGIHVMNMLHGALDAFTRVDSKAALEVAGREPESDEQYVAILRQLITYMIEDPRNITAALDAVWTARALERVGDHARNICEYVIYFVEGKDVRHISLEQIEKEIKTE
ncbi:MAG: phosphate transport system regulatory protein PhoU [Gammaproteobacteria bacterium RBG_16_51_14]|nr:MAG: phosphate transport system regulatory protein PhoU [Gammaproteobacteria bacterium RBG_16_51_14]